MPHSCLSSQMEHHVIRFLHEQLLDTIPIDKVKLLESEAGMALQLRQAVPFQLRIVVWIEIVHTVDMVPVFQQS